MKKEALTDSLLKLNEALSKQNICAIKYQINALFCHATTTTRVIILGFRL